MLRYNIEVSEKKKIRLDDLLLQRGLVPTRHQARILIRLGRVFSGTRRLEKPGSPVSSGLELHIDPGPRYVSRGGHKLEGALDHLNLRIAGRFCLDVGVSTGGFTDCLLQRGAEKVYAVDVNRNVVHEKILKDPKVRFVEKNARYLSTEDIPEFVDLIVMDLSFISVLKVIPALLPMLTPGGDLLILVKPQFELDRKEVGKGVVRDPELIHKAVNRVRECLEKAGLLFGGHVASEVAGPKGNVEQFLRMRAKP